MSDKFVLVGGEEDSWTPVSNTDDQEANARIEAFEKGKKAGRREHEEFFKKAFQQNINEACDIAENIHHFISSTYKVKPSVTLLKADNIDSFEALMVIPAEIYLDREKRNSIYKEIRGLRKQNSKQLFKIEVSLTSDIGELNWDVIRSQGFFIQYQK